MPPPLYFAKGDECHAMYEAVQDDVTKNDGDLRGASPRWFRKNRRLRMAHGSV